MNALKKFLRYQIISLSAGELAVMVVIVVAVNAIWAGVPIWAFAIIGGALGAAEAVITRRRGTP